MIINYQLDKANIDKRIRNLSSLPGGLKCNYLLTIKGPDDMLIAKQWKRKLPKSIGKNEVVIRF